VTSISCSFGCKSGRDADIGKRLRLVPHPDRAHAPSPKNFTGLSYDIGTLSDSNFFTASNKGLVDLFRKLTPNGILRLGGDSSGWWKGNSSSDVPSLPSTYVIPPHPEGYPFRPFTIEITPECIERLQSFLNATGWTCIYGLNLATGSPARAAEEASFVAKTLGSNLDFFQIGNEPDLLERFCRNPATWSADRYFNEWLVLATAVRAVVPHARFALPDLAWDTSWFAPVVNRLAALPDSKRPDVVGLSHHYYDLDPKTPRATINGLMKADPRLDRLAHECRLAAARMGLRYYITESNSCLDNGRAGISGAFASALWAADYILKGMFLGYSGIMMYSTKGAAAEIGQFESMKDPDSYHPRYRDSPICSPTSQMHFPLPIFYGIQFASRFAGAAFMEIDFTPGDVNATAYAAKLSSGQTAVAVINKESNKSLEMDLSGFSSAMFLKGAFAHVSQRC
jgi:hypothetical protein